MGCPYRSPLEGLAHDFGNWNTAQRRFRRWTEAVILEQLFNGLAGRLQLDTLMADGVLDKEQQHGTGAPKEDATATNPGLPKPLGKECGLSCLVGGLFLRIWRFGGRQPLLIVLQPSLGT